MIIFTDLIRILNEIWNSRLDWTKTFLERLKLIVICQLNIFLFAAAGFASDPDRLQVECDLFAEHIDYVEDVCKLISHVAVREADRVRAKHSQVNIIIEEFAETKQLN